MVYIMTKNKKNKLNQHNIMPNKYMMQDVNIITNIIYIMKCPQIKTLNQK